MLLAFAASSTNARDVVDDLDSLSFSEGSKEQNHHQEDGNAARFSHRI